MRQLFGEHSRVPSCGKPDILGSSLFWGHLLLGRTFSDLSRHQAPLEGLLKCTRQGPGDSPESPIHWSWCGAWAPVFPNKFPGASTRPVWGFTLRTAALVSGWSRGRESDGFPSLHYFLTSSSAFISSSLQHLCAPHSSAEPSLNRSGRKELPLARE